jgi:hypothetical protein
VLSAEEMGSLLASIDISALIGLRDRAVTALIGYTFARVTRDCPPAVAMWLHCCNDRPCGLLSLASHGAPSKRLPAAITRNHRVGWA